MKKRNFVLPTMYSESISEQRTVTLILSALFICESWHNYTLRKQFVFATSPGYFRRGKKYGYGSYF